MKENKAKILKNVAFIFVMLLFLGLVAGATYVIVYNVVKPTMLVAPTNLELLENNELTWDEVEGADSYTVQILNRTVDNEITIYVYSTMYTVSPINKIIYDISSEIDNDKNYSITVKANSNTIQNSGYSEAYELAQVDPVDDDNPYVEE